MCSGAGGLDLAVHAAFNATPAWFTEIDSGASQVLDTHWNAPNHRDVIETDWRRVDQVDIMCAGWPCQPFSLAGKQLGAKDERAIWPHIARALAILKPSVVILENVAAVINTDEYLRVCVNLLNIGYKVATITMPASYIGAPHKRNRLFIMAHRGAKPDINPPDAQQFSTGALLPTPTVQDSANCAGPAQHRRNSRPLNVEVTLLPTPRTTDSHGSGRRGKGGIDLRTAVTVGSQQWGKYKAAIRLWESLTRPAPSPTELNRNGKPRLNAAFSEWMMGWPDGWVTATPSLSRTTQLKIIGNGVVPQQAHAAIQRLAAYD